MTRLARPSPEQAEPALGAPVLAPVSAALNGAAGVTLSEAQLHTACAKYLDAVLSPEVIWTTIGHGGGGAIRGRKLKAMGVKKGVPDILICWEPRISEIGPRIGWIEVKSAKGRLTDEQIEFEGHCLGLGHEFAVVRSLAMLESILSYWRVPTRLSKAHGIDVELVRK